MDALREYIFSVTGAAVICAVLTQLSAGAGKHSTMIRLLGGLFLTFTVIRPVADIRFDDWSDYTLYIQEDAQEAISAGEDFAGESLEAIIKQETQAYILDKASSLGAEITVEVILDGESVPKEVYIQGEISPYAKSKLQDILLEDVGIAKENQIWIR